MKYLFAILICLCACVETGKSNPPDSFRADSIKMEEKKAQRKIFEDMLLQLKSMRSVKIKETAFLESKKPVDSSKIEQLKREIKVLETNISETEKEIQSIQ